VPGKGEAAATTRQVLFVADTEHRLCLPEREKRP